MTHDPMCSLAEPCLTAMPTHDCCNNHEDCTACATESGAACFACGNTCQCDLIARIRADEREKALEALMRRCDQLYVEGRISTMGQKAIEDTINSLRGES